MVWNVVVVVVVDSVVDLVVAVHIGNLVVVVVDHNSYTPWGRGPPPVDTAVAVKQTERSQSVRPAIGHVRHRSWGYFPNCIPFDRPVWRVDTEFSAQRRDLHCSNPTEADQNHRPPPLDRPPHREDKNKVLDRNWVVVVRHDAKVVVVVVDAL